MKKRIYLSLLILCSLNLKVTAQQFANGNFETNTAAACNLNKTNAQFNNLISGVTAFGLGENLDLIKDDCSFGPAQDGQYFIGLARDTGGKRDAFTLSLTSPLIVGQNYAITYYVRKNKDYPGVGYTFGCAPDSVRGGLLLNTVAAPTDTAWHKESFAFLAIQPYKYISITADANNGAWTHLDNFSLTPAPTAIGNEPLNGGGVTLFPNPASAAIHIKFAGSTGRRATIILCDIAGKAIKTIESSNSSETVIDVQDLSTGTYLVKCFNETTSFSKMIAIAR